MNETRPKRFADEDREIADQAFAWFVKLGSDEISDRDRIAFQRWLEKDTRHRSAYREAQAIWQDPRVVRALRRTRPERSGGSKPAVRIFKQTVFYVLPVVCLLAFLLDPVLLWRADYRTGHGERHSVTLADGSRLTLAPNSAVAINLEALREVRLLKGEVYCEVQSDPERAFIVQGRHSAVRVLGTRFSFMSHVASDTLTVAEGAVQFSRNGSDDEYRIVYADQSVTADARQFSQTRVVAARQAMAWTHGILALEQTPLAEVIERIRPYYPGWIWLSDETLQDLPVSGRFDLNDPRHLLDTLAQTLPIRVSRVTPWLAIVSRN